jgi:glycosyltransferase involved in cell wall biosynthesis
MRISILMPCLNEAETIEECIRKAQTYLAANNIDGEIVIADNGSTDNSVYLAERLNARVVRCEKKGYGAALKYGISQCKGEYVIFADCDCSYDFSMLNGFIEAFETGYEYVNGNRFKGGLLKGAMPFSHKIGVRVLSYIAAKKYKTPVLDYHCGLRGFKQSCINIDELKSDGFEFATELIAYAYKKRFKACEVPVCLYPDKRSRKPHLRTISDGIRHLQLILKGK